MTHTSDKALQRTALAVSCLASFMTPFMGQAINMALPTIGRQFGMDVIGLNWIVTGYALAAAMFLIPCSRIADIAGRKKVFTVGILIQTLGSLLCGLSTSGGWLIAFRGVQGFGGAMLFGTGMAVLTSVFPPERRGWALGFNTAAVYLGLSLGPPVGGFLTRYLSWRAVFFVHMPIGAAALALIWWKLEGEWTEAKGERFDWVGAILFGVAMAALMLGIPSFAKGASGAVGGSFAGAGLVGLCVFVFWEIRQRHPMLEVRLFVSHRVYGFSNLAALIHYSATASLGFLLSFYLQSVRGMAPNHAGYIQLVQPSMMALFSPMAGRWSDRMEPRALASTGMGLTLCGILALASVNADTSILFLVLNLAVMGFGFALFSSPNTNAVMGSVERRLLGVASGTLATMRTVGMMLGMGVCMLVQSRIIGPNQITPDRYGAFLHSMRVILVISSASCLVGIFASLARGNTREAAGGGGSEMGSAARLQELPVIESPLPMKGQEP